MPAAFLKPMKYLLVLAGRGRRIARSLPGQHRNDDALRQPFPLGTMAINVTGSFPIGLLMTLFTERFQPHTNLRLLLVVGFLGGYTTFSSSEWETFATIREGGLWIGLINVLGSVGLGYVAVWLGACSDEDTGSAQRRSRNISAPAQQNASTGETAVHRVPTNTLAIRSPTPFTAPIRPYAVPRSSDAIRSRGNGAL